jgi:hypothetical protein
MARNKTTSERADRVEPVPFHCLHSFAKRSSDLLGKHSVQPKSRSRPMQSATSANGKGVEARESAPDSPGLGVRVRTSDFLRISPLEFRIWFWLCQFRISFGFRNSDFGFPALGAVIPWFNRRF